MLDSSADMNDSPAKKTPRAREGPAAGLIRESGATQSAAVVDTRPVASLKNEAYSVLLVVFHSQA